MALKAILDSLDDLPDEQRALYREANAADGDAYRGKFILIVDAEDIRNHPNVKGLKSALDKRMGEVRTLKEQLAGWHSKFGDNPEELPEGFSVEEFERLKSDADGKKSGKIDERLAAQRVELEKKAGTEIEKRDKRIERLERILRRKTVDETLTASLLKEGVDPKLMPAARAMLKEKGIIKLEEDAEREDFNALVETPLGEYLPLPNYVAQWVTGEEGKPFIAKATGGNANGGTGSQSRRANPWKKDQWNATAQSQIIRDDPNLALSMAREAGVKPNWLVDEAA